ncbi:MAG: hypothetical protein KBC16_02765 [Candidatus Pacebacteria bacterium]|nr:hypothetical protein [Candidatus Paceibacterota bacterium]
MMDFIERLRAKPEHVRNRIALGTASVITGVITLGWFGALIAGNAFDLSSPNTTEVVNLGGGDGSTLPDAVANAKTGFSALFSGSEESGTSLDSGLTIIDVTPEEEPAPSVESRTIIPF